MSNRYGLSLRGQIEELAEKHLSAFFAEGTMPLFVALLVNKAFIEEWPDGSDVRSVRRAAKLLESPGWIAEDEPGVS